MHAGANSTKNTIYHSDSQSTRSDTQRESRLFFTTRLPLLKDPSPLILSTDNILNLGREWKKSAQFGKVKAVNGNRGGQTWGYPTFLWITGFKILFIVDNKPG
ncbi:hypothetical protein E05_46630 [Plautia stali symbiont]|nr:hypothetical protein E05_46630 [Plautia stali symbiont]